MAGENGQANMTGMDLREQSERNAVLSAVLVADAVSSRYRGKISKAISVSDETVHDWWRIFPFMGISAFFIS